MIDVSLALPFSLGIVTAINPCGFAMLPTWLGYFIGRSTADREPRPEQVVRGLWVSLLLTSTFVATFGVLGLAVSHLVSEESVARRTPWITVVLGFALIPYGLAVLVGRQSGIPFLRPTRGPSSREGWSVVGFGMSYAVVSVGCASPLFLLQIAGSFSRDGIVEGTATYVAYAAGMAAVVTSLTLSLAMARGGVARNLRRLLPFMNRIGALALMLGGAYLVVFGIYEIRVLGGSGTAGNPVVDAVGDLQLHLTSWVAEVGGLQVGLALWMAVMTLVVWGLDPALSGRARTASRTVLAITWVATEGFGYQGDLLVLPVTRVVGGWPSRGVRWFDDPTRWAVPLEVLLTSAVILVVTLSASATFRRWRQ
ncbi:MAG: cytochrome c biogenesis protein CcdA [Actinomycetota bacterium]|nr:cytochrome c biogenesis protein CcdA [Actinomycetota bacterium]